MDKLSQWIINQLSDRGWSQRELARRSELSQSRVNNVINGIFKPDADFCLAIAKALNTPPEPLLHLAGILPQQPEPALKETQVLYLFRSLPPEKQDSALQMLYGLAGDGSKASYSAADSRWAVENAPASTAQGQAVYSTARGNPATEQEQTFYAFLDDLSDPDNPHRQQYDALWDAAQTEEEKLMVVRLLAAAAEKYKERGKEKAEEPGESIRARTTS